MKEEGVNGIVDMTFIWTQPLNEYFQPKERVNILLICDSLTMDFLVCVQGYRFLRFGTTWRFIFAILPFYALRALIQGIDTFEFPEGYNWDFPGWFSEFVPYGVTPDFFYSGHVGSCIIHFYEFRACGWYWWSYYAIFVMFCQIFTMEATRSHYSIDMIAGMIIAHYLFIMSSRYVYLFDYYILGIPLEKRIATIDQIFLAK